MVLWLLCLGALTGCMAFAISLGSLQQQAVNVQNAADSAALDGAETLAPNVGSLVDMYVPIPAGGDCRVTNDGAWTAQPRRNGDVCQSYSWLDDYYVYESPTPQGVCQEITCEGWWHVVPPTSSSAAGEIDDQQAFDDATSAGLWQCWLTDRHYCTMLYTGVDNAQTSWDLSGPGYNPAVQATADVTSTTGDYGVTAQSSACPTSPPSQFSLVEGWGKLCLAYEITPKQHVLFWVQLDYGGVTRTAWASSYSGALCSGPPPGGNCDPQ